MISHQVSSREYVPQRVVLLGARGFIGAALKRQLEADGVPTLAPTSADVDLSDPGATEKLAILLKSSDTVVMLAALTPDKGRDTNTLLKNLAMMQSVCAALNRVGCAHLVYFSSDAVYNAATSLITEDTPASPQDLYGAMHHTREVMARSIERIPLLILRPTLVYGLDDTHNAYGPNRFRRTAQQEGKITLFGDSEETRDHIHVDDVAKLTMRCIIGKSTGTLNIATGISKSFREIAEMVAGQFNEPIALIAAPRANSVAHRHYDVTNLIKAFPDFRFVALLEGLASMHREVAGET